MMGIKWRVGALHHLCKVETGREFSIIMAYSLQNGPQKDYKKLADGVRL